jgi:sterol desaturase/sphingolipid hydroxylase (fatty acid hydroxylase superfamily)
MQRILSALDMASIVNHNSTVQEFDEEPEMKFDTGTIIAVAAVLLFYLRLIVLQRQRVQRASKNLAKGSKKLNPVPSTPAWVVVRNSTLVGAGVLLIAMGAVVSIIPWFQSFGPSWWWLPVTVGILLMGLGVG